MAQSILQSEKRCYFTGEPTGRRGQPLEKHHIMNGALRSWAEDEGLWIWVDPDIHRFLHSEWIGVLVQKRLLKQIAQTAYEKAHTREEWMEKVHRNYR